MSVRSLLDPTEAARLVGLVRAELHGVGTPRQVLAVACLAWLLLPTPDPTSWGGVLLVVGLLATAVTVNRPGGTGALIVLLVGVLGWLTLLEDGSWRALPMAAAGYAVHTVAAVAAGLPAGVRLDRTAWWALARCGLLALALGVLVVQVAGVATLPASGLVIGVAVVVGLLTVVLPKMLLRWAAQ